jgi:GNAT superfamily N-acetyltransferase
VTEIILDPHAPEVPAAVEAIMCEEVGVFAHYLPGAVRHVEPDVTWWITGRLHPMYNGVWLARLALDQIDRRIEAILAPFRVRSVPCGWSVGPTTVPSDLGSRLGAHGLRLVASQTAMTLDLLQMRDDFAPPPNLRVEVVREMGTLVAWRRASNRGFEADKESADIYDTAYLALGCSEALPWRHFLALLDGEPVATSSLLLHAGIVGVFGVATIPEARRRGIGAAVTLAALRYARDLGFHVAMLTPSEMSVALYRRIGFTDCCTVRHYAWLPASP